MFAWFISIKKNKFFFEERKKIYQHYYTKLKNFNENLKFPNYSKNIKPSFHLFIININFKNIKKKKLIYAIFNYNKILAQQHYIPIYKFNIYNKKKNKICRSRKLL